MVVAQVGVEDDAGTLTALAVVVGAPARDPIVGRRKDRPEEFAAAHPEAKVRAVAADLSTAAGMRGPGPGDAGLLDAVFRADLAAFGAQSPELATRYRAA